ncbi:MAG TPA: tetratricopeptide repeat protein [Gemmataceae bacterium]|nr:tetratricopeptide repeat protein [Gemmataceae bacterium]
MLITRIVPRLAPVLTGVLLVCLAVAAAAADDDALRKRALELNYVTGSDAIEGQVATLVQDAAGTRKLLAAAQAMIKEKDQPLNVNALYILGRAAQLLKEYEAGRAFYRAYADQALKLQSGMRLAQAFGGLIDVLYASEKFEEAVKVCREFLEIQGDDNVTRFKPVVLRRMIQALARQGKSEEALKLVDNLVKAQPSNWLALELKGWVLREAGQYDESAKVYEEVLDRINKDKGLTKEEREEFGADVRYLLSGVYVDAEQVDKAAEHLKALLAKDPNNPTYNNDLGYIWADHDMNLDEAEKLIRKAIDEDRKQRKKLNPDLKPEEDKDNAAYLDSLGWVLFKKKKFKEAKEWLQKAVELPDGQHVEIYDHLGDVHWALGEKAEAIAAWKKGIEVAGSGKREQKRKAEVEKKLKEHQ